MSRGSILEIPLWQTKEDDLKPIIAMRLQETKGINYSLVEKVE